MPTGSLIINNLAGLLIITSLLVVMIKKPTTSALMYAVQSFVLVLILMALGNAMNASELYIWAFTAFITKVILVPTIMYKAFKGLPDPKSNDSILSGFWIIVCSAIMIVVCYFAASKINLEQIKNFTPVFAVSLSYFLIGVVCIVSQRNILKQVFGYCLMENGAHLTLALLANKTSELVEIGIATDSIFAVIIMVYMVKRIYGTLHTLDVKELIALKG